MTIRTESDHPSRSADPALWLAGGAVWLAAGLVDGGSLEAIWIVADLLLLAALVRLWRVGPGRRWRPTTPATLGLALAIGARVVFLAAEVLAALSGDDENLLLPLGAVGTALGLLVLGAAVARHPAAGLRGARRFALLAAGGYPFASMFPVIAATGEPSVLAIALWGVPMMLVGLALAGAPVPEPRPAPRALAR